MNFPESQTPAPSELRSFIDRVPALAWSALPEGSLEFSNQTFRDYTGLSSDNLCGAAWKSAVHQDDIHHLEARWQDLRQSQEAGTIEMRLRRFDGEYRWFRIAVSPVHDEQGNLIRWCGITTDVNDLRSSAQSVGPDGADLTITDAIPISISVLAPDGTTLYCNRRSLDRIGVTLDEVIGEGHLKRSCHPDDLDRILDERRIGLSKGVPFELEIRYIPVAPANRIHHREYRWNLVQYSPLKDEFGKVIRWYVTATDIHDRKRAEEELKRSEEFLAEGQRLSRTGTFSWCIATDEITWSEQLYCIFEFDVRLPVTLERIGTRVYPDDLPFWRDMVEGARNAASDFEYQYRLLMPDESVKHIHLFAHATRDRYGRLEYVGAAQDVTDLHSITDAIANPVVVLTPEGTRLYANRVAWNQLGLTRKNTDSEGCFPGICHPDDFQPIRDKRRVGLEKHDPFELEMRLLTDGQYRWYLCQYNPLKDEQGHITRWYATATDIDDRKRAEQRLQQSEAELRTITDAIRQYVVVLAPDGKILYTNRVALDLTGLTIGEVNDGGYFPRAFHPDDVDRVLTERQEKLLRGTLFDLEMRLLLKNGQYRWHLFQYEPLTDERGRVIRWYCTATDIDDQKRTEERLRNENFRLDQERVYLEEQIRRELGYEQIIGNSPALKQVLELVETVASSDSTVLLLGETGTGKELIARAVHERSRRKAKTFVKLNCAAIPTGLLESELFGHEKGAFTGAIIQKVGRMELADQGTLFLDEVGDIPIEIQPKLLRALQEREFERLGSTHTRKVSVRLVAATNCNLERMVADREFRSDLFYRLNVFPIRIPPLRDRKEDIPLLASYFAQKFAKQMQKRIDSIPVATMKELTAWEWPGNIRELENFIERAVILTKGSSLAAPLGELRKMTADEPVRESAPTGGEDIARILKQTLASLIHRGPENEHAKRQHEEIVRVLTECKGRVGGADGAAARMGLSRTTLISRMKKLGINPYDYA